MEVIDSLFYGLQVAAQPENILAALIGALAGTVVGVLPGLGPTAGAAILLPLTFSFDPVTGLIMIAAIYYGVQYGGSTTAILLNIAGEANSVPTMRDGYQMTLKGRAGPALSIVTIGSFIAGTASIILVAGFGSGLAHLGMEFGSAEFLAIIVIAIVVLTTALGGSLTSNLLPLLIGMGIGTVGLDPVSAAARFTFGNVTLSQGIEIVAVTVGLFGLVELLELIWNPQRTRKSEKVRLRDLPPSRDELRRSWAPWGRGTAVGFLAGLIPGPAPAVATFTAYRVEKSVSRHRHELGSGAVEGIAAPEAANNAAATSGMIPLLSLGLPFTPALALMMAAMIVQGVTPGPLLVDQHPDIFWGVIASMYVGNIVLVLLNLPMIGVWVAMLRVPRHLLIGAISLLALVGSFVLNQSVLDLWVLIIAGVVGFVLARAEFQLAPVALGMILGPFAEKYTRDTLAVSGGELNSLFSSPLAMSMWIATGAWIVMACCLAIMRRVRSGATTHTSEAAGTQSAQVGDPA